MNKVWVIAGALSVLVLGAVALLAGSAFYAADKYNEAKVAEPAGTAQQYAGNAELAAKETVQNFYDSYIAGETDWSIDPSISDLLKQRMAAEAANFDMGGGDPVLCSQDLPKTFSVDVLEPVTGSAVAMVGLDFDTAVKNIRVSLAREAGGQWRINDINCGSPVPMEEARGEQTAIVYFNNAQRAMPEDKSDCGAVFGVKRSVPAGANYYEVALNELFKGPADDEVLEGYVSSFSEETSDSLLSVTVKDATAYVNLRDIREIIPEAGSSCGGEALLSQIEETVKHKREVSNVVIAIEGDPVAFYEWLQMDCNDPILCNPKNFI